MNVTIQDIAEKADGLILAGADINKDMMGAIGLLQTFNKYGVNVPADISIIGFDNIDLTAYITLKITTISVDKKGVDQEAAHRLFDRIQNPEKTTNSVIPTELITRKSVREIK